MLEYFRDNQWFINQYWPENEPRVQTVLSDLARLVPKGSSVFDPGCGNGYISFLASRIGYKVVATDAWSPPDREELFRRADIDFFPSNLNVDNPWPNIVDQSFEAVLFGEVFEHLLNHPVGLLIQIRRVLKPGGVLLLTTPNPSTLVNAVRVLLDRHSLWGTEEFANTQKIIDGKVIDRGEIHYREYRSTELCACLTRAGFRVESSGYLYLGSPPTHRLKWLLKRMLGPLMRARLLATCNYMIASTGSVEGNRATPIAEASRSPS